MSSCTPILHREIHCHSLAEKRPQHRLWVNFALNHSSQPPMRLNFFFKNSEFRCIMTWNLKHMIVSPGLHSTDYDFGLTHFDLRGLGKANFLVNELQVKVLPIGGTIGWLRSLSLNHFFLLLPSTYHASILLLFILFYFWTNGKSTALKRKNRIQDS